jgi:hypothetical protein
MAPTEEETMSPEIDMNTAWAITGKHVYPANDLREHALKIHCWCRPIEDAGVIVHNSLDGREHYQNADRKPS